ncbi:MAG: hypothetical protein GY757_18525 [bacterium]|nr:hypothetical protein [bacterium]
MGLQPDYVETLQQSWMRDDFSTITNTYPDHEDIMGPAGIDVPEVMTRFIPPRAGLVTTEEQMLPVLKNGASGQKTKLTAAGWLEAGLITDDILARFPYNEHPYNIALVLGLAGELGIPEDFALKEMADRVVAEIGMLKTYPRAPIRRRTLEFTNGMAANERMGFLSNWERTGFACQNYESEPGVFISTVVNNRADRIPRSQVFAQIIVDDISADRFFLIGSNLNGLMGYIQTAWHKKMAQLSLWDHDKEESGSNDSPVALLNQMTRAMRIPMNETILQARLKIMLGGLSPSGREKGAIENLLLLWNRPAELAEGLAQLAVDKSISEELAAVYEKEFSAFTAYNQLKESIQKALPAHREDLNSKFKDTLSKWFHRKIIVIKDYHASGDTVVHTICNETPPGFLNRIMGIQNIKGTGMEFVNRWFAFEACFRACEKLAADDPVSRKKGMDALVGLRDFGLLSEFTVEKALEAVGDSGDMHDELFHSNLLISETNFKNNMKEVKDNLLKQGEKKGFLAGMVDWLERFIDPLAGVKRKKKVKRIYRDLTGERISQQQATTQLKILKKAQEGGWLYKRLELMFKKASGGPATRGWADPPGAPTRGAPRGGTP